MAAIGTLIGLQTKFGQKSFTLMTFESQGTPTDVLKKFISDRKINYPVSASGGGSFDSTGLPAVWIIGVEGKIVYAGSGGGEDGIISKELEKIKYPGLGKLEVNPKVVGAATAFGAKDYTGAKTQAQKVIDKAGDKPDEAAITDAKYVIEKVNAVHAKLNTKATTAEGEKEYLVAQTALEAILSGFGAKSEEGKAAKAKLDAWKKDKAIQKEINALKSLADILKTHADSKPDTKNEALDGFIKANKGTKAAEKAASEKVSVEPAK